jgi:hypothetical protein
MTTSSITTILMGPTLKFNVDQSNSILKLVKADGSQVNVWGQTLQYAFAPGQATVTVSCTPVVGTDAVTTSYVDGQGTTVTCTQQNGSAMLTLPCPPNPGVSFNIDVDQGSTSLAAVRSAQVSPTPVATARMVSASTLPVEPRADHVLSVSRQVGLAVAGATNPSPKPTGPGARLQTRLVLSTVNPPPDPDARPHRSST